MVWKQLGRTQPLLVGIILICFLHKNAFSWVVLRRQGKIPSAWDFQSHIFHKERNLLKTLFLEQGPDASPSSIIDVYLQPNDNRRPKKSTRSFQPGVSPEAFQKFKQAKVLERRGKMHQALSIYSEILDQFPYDSYSHLALARLVAKLEKGEVVSIPLMNATATPKDSNTTSLVSFSALDSKAATAYHAGITKCPKCIYLWQSWAIYEDSRGNTERARELFEKALSLDAENSHTCQAYALFEKRHGNSSRAIELLSRALRRTCSAPLVCSLAEIFIAQGEFTRARELYSRSFRALTSDRYRVEVCLAAAWLEEKYFKNFNNAHKILKAAREHYPGSALASVALARFETRLSQGKHRYNYRTEYDIKMPQLSKACNEIEASGYPPTDPQGGRAFNAWAQLEGKFRQYEKAREILQRGIQLFPLDSDLLTSAGKVEEKLGNFTGARNFYVQCLKTSPSSSGMLALVMMELRKPRKNGLNINVFRRLFEMALVLDPRHGAVYHAYGTAEYNWGNIDKAREVFTRGIRAQCKDVVSLFHGYANFELNVGNEDAARTLLEEGIETIRNKTIGTDSATTNRATFLFHTLGMLEMSSYHISRALYIFMDGLSLCGKDSELQFGAAICEMKLGRIDVARYMFEQTVALDPKHAQAWRVWGLMETNLGNYDLASKVYTAGIQNVPSCGELWLGFAKLEAMIGNINQARRCYELGLKWAPAFPALLVGWSFLELYEENYNKAKKLVTSALQMNKYYGSAWIAAAALEKQLGNTNKMVALLQRGIEFNPMDGKLYKKLGDYFAEILNVKEARNMFEKGIEVLPRYAPLYHSLAELEARIGNMDALHRLHIRAKGVFQSNILQETFSSTEDAES